MTAEFNLWCYVKGDSGNSHFEVTIPSSQNINDLKEQIYTNIRNSELQTHSGTLYHDLFVNTVVINGPCWLVTSAD